MLGGVAGAALCRTAVSQALGGQVRQADISAICCQRRILFTKINQNLKKKTKKTKTLPGVETERFIQRTCLLIQQYMRHGRGTPDLCADHQFRVKTKPHFYKNSNEGKRKIMASPE